MSVDGLSQVEPRSASCLCGSVRIEITGKVGPLVYCHCTMCQRASGTAFSANVDVRRRYWKILDGADRIREFESSPGIFRAFCSRCGSPLYSRRDANPEIFRIRLGQLNADPGRRSLAHFWVGSQVPWFEITDELPRFEGGPEDHADEVAEKLGGS